MNTSLGPKLTNLETIHAFAWRVTATASVAFGRARCPQPCGVARTRYTPRVGAGKGTAYAVKRPEWRSLQPRGITNFQAAGKVFLQGAGALAPA